MTELPRVAVGGARLLPPAARRAAPDLPGTAARAPQRPGLPRPRRPERPHEPRGGRHAPPRGGVHRRRFEGFLDALGRRVVLPYRRVIVAAAAVFTVAGAVLGADVVDHLSAGGFEDRGSSSWQASTVIDERFAAHDANLVLVVTAREGTVDDRAVAADGRRVTERVRELPGLREVSSYWSLGGAPGLRSPDGRQALVLANVPGDDDQVTRTLEELEPALDLDTDAVTVGVGGPGAVYRDVAVTVERDLRRAELLAFPVTGVLLALVFGTLVAASLPLAMGLVSVVGTVVVLLALSAVTSVSVYALNLATGLGLGLAIDYALFMLSRFREERDAGLPEREAILVAMQTAGRAVTVSGLTVASSLLVLVLFPLEFLRSFAYAGIAVSLLAVLNALVVLPALLAVAGPRIERWPVLPRLRRGRSRRAWQGLARAVIRRPVVYLVSCGALLALLGSPFLHARLALPDDRVLPESAPSRIVQDDLRASFPQLATDPVQVVVPDGRHDERSRAVDAYAVGLSRLPDVLRVEAVTGVYADGSRVEPPGPTSASLGSSRGTLLAVVPAVDAMSQRGERLVSAVRSLPAPFPVQVGGRSAQLVDVKDALGRGLPWALALMAGTTLVALFFLFGAVVVPVKAVLLNLLSLTATFGAMVWVFQDGNLAGLLGFTPTGSLDVTIPILMLCMAFGLSMDYEVFIMSRIKEAYDRTGDSDRAVVEGLGRTGGLVTTLALIIATVFASFATSGVTFIKLMGVGLALAVLMDATLVRGLLLPAVMRLTRSVNWWAPGWLRAVHARWAPRGI